MNDALWALEHKNTTIPVIMALSMGYNTVNHTVLLEVLHKCFGMEGMALDWFHTYLSSRFFKVNIGDAYSNLKKLIFSVPQRSCACQNLSHAYSSTLANWIPNEININGYADDHSLQKVFQAGDKDGEQRAINEIETCIIYIETWLHTWILRMAYQLGQQTCF